MMLKQGDVKKLLVLVILSFFGISILLIFICHSCSEAADCATAGRASGPRSAPHQDQPHHPPLPPPDAPQVVVDRVVSGGEVSGHRLCLLVPFRDRFEELLEFAPTISRFLTNQGINHEIWVINQADGFRFNRASLINSGYHESSPECDYVAMHDVDLIPLNSKLNYGYPEDAPFHVASPDLHPKYDYPTFIGGIFLITREQFKQVNGMSNKYWGWGLEDDEFFVRLRQANIMVKRPENIRSGRSDTFKHIHNPREKKRDMRTCYNQKNATRRRDRQTGLSSVVYRVESRRKLSIDGAEVNFLSVSLECDTVLTPWCNCTGAPPDTEPVDRSRDEEVVVPIVHRNRNKINSNKKKS